MTVIAPAVTFIDWSLATCRNLGPAVMHPEPQPTGRKPVEPLTKLDELLRTQDGMERLVALEVCGPCPIRTQCLEFALANHETEGVWGGLSAQQRRAIRRQRQVGSRAHYRRPNNKEVAA